MNTYKILNKQLFTKEEFTLEPIRFEDKWDIMKWRNDQIDILRQKEFLTEEMQNSYFNNVVKKLFNQNFPSQLLFSYFEKDNLIGYGGLVHINWDNLFAEISYLFKTELINEKNYHRLTSCFLDLVYDVAKDAKLHKIYTYGYDINEYRFTPLIDMDFKLDAKLSKHVKINKKFYDVRIYSKIIQQ